jgi:aminopeptidase N
MRKLIIPLYIIALTATSQACKSIEPSVITTEYVTLDTVNVEADSPREMYRASEKKITDLLHTKLEVSFDWDSAFLFGRANLTLSPYFYPSDSLVLDAKGFEIKEVALLDKIGKKSPLKYVYDKEFLKIDLGKTYTRLDTYRIFIDYTAMPNKLNAGGSSAITSDKGLYFINNDGKIADKPKQIWTQGETESSSCWFPTIDSPNEKTTQEIYITVDSNYTTLSNGELMFQSENEDGTRTDYWKQNLPHAPYLFMMAIGEFAVAKDKWRGKPVHYFVEKKYADVAKDIYPNTVEMLEFFSNRLGYEYPWDKYHQVVVRDYVSGAMENTGAVIFGDFIQGNRRFLIDNSGEDIVAHEMFHHWFGDLVTCESWSNLPLNESFATYGEYLWNEHKYGKNQADLHIDNDLKVYLGSSRINKETLIRFNYDNHMEMFDAHSYQKGGRVLHMLRNYVGDDAFFESLKVYLTDNEFQTVEIHNLRLAFEKVTGEDLNWFFNQWFLSPGHPIIKVEKSYANGKLTVSIKQTQEGEDIPYAFEIPTDLQIVQANGLVMTKKIRLTQRTETFEISLTSEPLLVNFDTRKIILGVIDQAIKKEEAITLFQNATHFLDKVSAIRLLKSIEDSVSLDLIELAMKDGFWSVRKSAIKATKKLAKERPESTLITLKTIASSDLKSNNRAAAVSAISKYFIEEVEMEFLVQRQSDLSYTVVSACLDAINKKDPIKGLAVAKELEKEDNAAILATVASIYATNGDPKKQAFFEHAISKTSGYGKYGLMNSYGDFLMKQNDEAVEKALPILIENSKGDGVWYVRMAGVNSLIKMKSEKEKAIEQLAADIAKTEDVSEIEKLRKAKLYSETMKAKFITALEALKEEETNSNLKRMIEGALE